jgi:outer membrane protein assembly factor BamA
VKRFILLFILTVRVAIYAEEIKIENPDDDKTLKEPIETTSRNDNNNKWGIAPVGIPYYTPDTSWGVGGQIIFYYNPSDTSGKTNEISVYGTYTLLNQAAAGTTANLFLGENFKITGIIESSKYPGYFWGIGPKAEDDAKEKYTVISFVTKEGVLYNVFRNLYLGPTGTFFYSKNKDKEKNGLLALDDIPGSRKAKSVGAGLNINWHNTDSYFYPHRGFLVDIKETNFFQAIGSTYNYSKWEFDLRYFLQVHDEHVIGFQFVSILSQGEVPLHNLAELGGNVIMRGYLRGRYRDKNLAAFQAEYRYPLFWRLGGTVFGGAGTVVPAFGKFEISNTKKAAGAGLRLNIDKSQHINLRLDAGITEDGEVNAYFLVKEAF